MLRGENLRTMRRFLILFLLVALLAACGGAKKSPAPDASSRRLSSTAKISIVEPMPGAKVKGTEVAVRIGLEGGTVVPQASRDLKPDEGHVHLRLDGAIITLLGGLEETVPVRPGTHVIEVEFAASDHGPFNPRVVTTVAFEVE